MAEVTPKDLMVAFQSAARTDRKLPHWMKKQSVTAWFDVNTLQDAKLAYGYHDAEYTVRLSTSAVSLWELCIYLFLLMPDVDMRRLVWARANNFGWKELSRRFGYHRSTVYKKYLLSLYLLCDDLDKEKNKKTRQKLQQLLNI
tara:strand:- start:3508 stop:3936 length:429 start_codon:yes stop_codon:yes gene_type:complete